MNHDEGFELLDFSFNNGKKRLRLKLTYFNRVPKIDIREYYFDTEALEYRPSKKGVQLDSSRAEALRSALEQNAEIINDHLIGGDLERWASSIKKIESEEDYLSNYEFFKSESQGSRENIIFNTNHPIGRRLREIDLNTSKDSTAEELMGIVKLILVSHEHSLSHFHEEGKTRVGDFIQDQKQVWSALLKRLFLSESN